MNRIVETMGSIAKVEKLETLNSNILENTLVLEEIEPFPGYHGANLPTGYNPTAVYLVLKKKVSTVKIMRITQNIHKYFKPGFDATAAQVCINNDVFNCIRLRNLESHAIIPELQKNFMHEGLKFMKKKKISGEGVIEVKKHFELEKIDEGIYKDLEDPLMYYLQIPNHLNWSVFLEITTSIRQNLDNLSFDGALGAIYMQEITEVVRIFVKDVEVSDLQQIRQRYLEELRKY
ncbi:hypothetical protein ACFLR8_00235 [Bacteroidota bacterium]